MRGIFRHALPALALPLLVATGCATVGDDEWTGTPPEAPPEELQEWDIEWDDQRHVWREHGSREQVGNDEVRADAWEYEQDAVAIRISASRRLNVNRSVAHTAAVHVLQARDPGELRRQLEYPSEVYRLLRRGDDDPDVLAMDRSIVEPGRETLVRIDRADQTRYLVLVIGYADYSRQSATRIIELPQVYDIPRGRERFAPGNVLDTLNPFSSTPPPRPARVEGWLDLGEDGIDRLRMVAR